MAVAATAEAPSTPKYDNDVYLEIRDLAWKKSYNQAIGVAVAKATTAEEGDYFVRSILQILVKMSRRQPVHVDRERMAAMLDAYAGWRLDMTQTLNSLRRALAISDNLDNLHDLIAVIQENRAAYDGLLGDGYEKCLLAFFEIYRRKFGFGKADAVAAGQALIEEHPALGKVDPVDLISALDNEALDEEALRFFYAFGGLVRDCPCMAAYCGEMLYFARAGHDDDGVSEADVMRLRRIADERGCKSAAAVNGLRLRSILNYI